jgi:DNA-binding SARP family transcriptional activator
VRIAVLGETEAWLADGRPVTLGTRKQRAIVAALAMSQGRPVSYDALVDLLWRDAPPDGLPGTLHVYIAGLRRTLEPDRAPRTPATVLVSVGGGYALRVPVDEVDAGAFERAVTAAHRSLAAPGLLDSPALGAEGLADVATSVDEALGRWRGPAYADLDDHASVVAERARLEELRSVALEDRAVIGLALGEHGRVAGELESLVAAYPLRERLWGLRALALTRAGRQADALDALARLREVLDEELGLEPSAELRDLQTAILRQDPRVSWSAPDRTAAPRPSRPARAPQVVAPVLPPWPLVGRSEQLSALIGALRTAASGSPTYAALTGDPGIGKSRLCAELATRAVAEGALVLLGRCSQDDGAPPLWPWQQVLRGLGHQLEVEPGDDEGAEFRTWESVVDRVVAAAQDQTLVVVLDDLHWADPPTLRVLRLLTSTVQSGRLLVLATWRSHPEPTGALADAVEALARQHALRLELGGLGPEQAAEVVAAVTEATPNLGQAAVLAARTDGNPFFLVEYARLARDGGDLDALMREADPPTAVNDVLLRRIAMLPDAAVGVLRWAGVIGRSFDLDVLAGAAGLDEDEVLDGLDPALAAGLVREDGIGRYLFGHALVRDAIYGSVGTTRRARAHARVAEALEGSADRESEIARHWLAAGPAYAGRTWRAAAAAAAAARRIHAYERSAEMLGVALEAAAKDPAHTPRDRYDLLMELADAHRWRGDWTPLLATIEAAIGLADELDDVELLARAASAMTFGALWQSAGHGEVHGRVVDALRRCLDRLPDEDDPLRCRAVLSLANELYYGASNDERTALVEEGLAMGARLGDDELVMYGSLVGFVTLWAPDTVRHRLALAEQAAEIAAEIGNERAFTIATTLTAVAHGELGDVVAMWECSARARTWAERLRLPYGLLVVETLELPWLALAGRFDDAERRLAAVETLAEQMELFQKDEALAGALLSLRLWQGRGAEVLPLMMALQGGPLPVTTLICLYLLRTGQREEAAAYLQEHDVDLSEVNWFSLLNWVAAAEAGLGVGDAELAATAYDLLAPYAGQMACGGSGTHLGPIDAFLAMASCAVGEGARATEHAERATKLMEEWQIPLAAQWWRDQRDHYGF